MMGSNLGVVKIGELGLGLEKEEESLRLIGSLVEEGLIAEMGWG